MLENLTVDLNDCGRRYSTIELVDRKGAQHLRYAHIKNIYVERLALEAAVALTVIMTQGKLLDLLRAKEGHWQLVQAQVVCLSGEVFWMMEDERKHHGIFSLFPHMEEIRLEWPRCVAATCEVVTNWETPAVDLLIECLPRDGSLLSSLKALILEGVSIGVRIPANLPGLEILVLSCEGKMDINFEDADATFR